jgi:sialic acid synthase SpsE
MSAIDHRTVTLGRRIVGDGQPTYVVAEIGINHNGDVDNTRYGMRAAGAAFGAELKHVQASASAHAAWNGEG